MPYQHLTDRYGLPESIKVHVKKTGNIYYAKLPDYPGCMTMAEDSLDLIIKVNDAILTYFQVPRGEATKCNFLYFPEVRKNEKNKESHSGGSITEEFRSYTRCYA